VDIFEFIFKHPFEYNLEHPHWRDGMSFNPMHEGGALQVGVFILFVFSVPCALYVIRRAVTRAKSLLASMAPFTMAALYSHVHSFGIYSTVRILDDVVRDQVVESRFFWIGTVISISLAILSPLIQRNSNSAS
jgi:uncharacterized membrane protein